MKASTEAVGKHISRSQSHIYSTNENADRLPVSCAKQPIIASHVIGRLRPHEERQDQICCQSLTCCNPVNASTDSRTNVFFLSGYLRGLHADWPAVTH